MNRQASQAPIEKTETVQWIPEKKMGRKGDAIIRKLSGGMKLEFGGSEAGRHYEGQGATKWLHESGLKLPKMMRDMFVSLCKNTDWNLEKMEKMETVGYIHGGTVLLFYYYFLHL